MPKLLAVVAYDYAGEYRCMNSHSYTQIVSASTHAHTTNTHTRMHRTTQQTSAHLENVGEVATQADDEDGRVQVLREPMERRNEVSAARIITRTCMFTHGRHPFTHHHGWTTLFLTEWCVPCRSTCLSCIEDQGLCPHSP
jgi:hypothetical protein